MRLCVRGRLAVIEKCNEGLFVGLILNFKECFVCIFKSTAGTDYPRHLRLRCHGTISLRMACLCLVCAVMPMR